VAAQDVKAGGGTGGLNTRLSNIDLKSDLQGNSEEIVKYEAKKIFEQQK
jgi:hypothetical protein